MQHPPPRAALIEAMARAHCRHSLGTDPDELDSQGAPFWRLCVEDMEPVLDAVIATSASLTTLAPVLARIARAA